MQINEYLSRKVKIIKRVSDHYLLTDWRQGLLIVLWLLLHVSR